MKDFVKRMVEEHAQLVTRIQKLNDYIYSEKSDKDSKAEFANKCVQLAAMRKYEEALAARLYNQGITLDIDTGEYKETIGYVNSLNHENETSDK